LVLAGAAAACLALAAQPTEAHDFFRRLLTGNQPMSDFPGTGWDQFAPLLASLALMAVAIVALAVGGPLGGALGLGVLGVSTYSSYRHGGWRQVLDDHNPFGFDFWDALLNPGLSGRERLAKLTLSAFKGASVVPGVRGAVTGLQRFSSSARVVAPRMTGAAGAASRPIRGPSGARPGALPARRTPPPPPARLPRTTARPGAPPPPRRPPDTRAAELAEKLAFLESRKAEDIVRKLFERIVSGHHPRALDYLGRGGLGPVKATPVGRFHYQVDPAGCAPAVVSHQLERAGIRLSPLDVEMRAKALGLWTPRHKVFDPKTGKGVYRGGMNVDQEARLLRSYGVKATRPAAYNVKQLGQDVRQGRQVSARINNSSNPSRPNYHRVSIESAPPRKGMGPEVIVGDPHSGAKWRMTLDQLGRMKPRDVLVVH
jgi:hypothetical protein